MNIHFQKVIEDLELLIREDLVEHEDNRRFVTIPEDNYIINPSSVVQDTITLLKEYDSALCTMVYQYCTIDKRFLEVKSSVMPNPDQEVFFNSYMSAGEEAFRMLGIKNGEDVPEDWLRW